MNMECGGMTPLWIVPNAFGAIIKRCPGTALQSAPMSIEAQIPAIRRGESWVFGQAFQGLPLKDKNREDAMAFRNLFVFILAMLLVFAVLSANFYLEWPPRWSVHLSVLAMVVGGMFLFTFANYSPRELAIALRALFSPAMEKKQSDYEKAFRLFRAMSRYAWASAGLGFLIGLIKLLLRITDPATIAPNMAFALFSILYGLFFGEIVCGLCEGQAEKMAR